MMLLAPWALWFAAVGAAVVALYVLKIKRRRQTVPALEFWRALAGRTKVHSLFQRLKRLLSMLLWLAIAACLVLAIGNPILSFGKIKPRAIAVIIDNSVSMQTLEREDEEGASTTRLALAREALTELTTRRPVSDEWLLIEAGSQPRVRQTWTYDGKAVREAAERIAPFAGTSDVQAAIALADQLLAGKMDPAIVVIGDHGSVVTLSGAARPSEGSATPRGDEAPPDGNTTAPELVHWPVGNARDNLGITRLAARLNRQESNYHVLVGVLNASDQAVDTQLTFEIDGTAMSVELATIQPASTWEKVIVLDAPSDGGGISRGGVLRVSIDREDALSHDNAAYAILEPMQRAIVWLVTPMDEAYFFEQALAAMDDLVWAEESLTLTLDQYQRVMEAMARGPGDGASDESSLVLPDMIIFNNGAPEAMPTSGRFVMINDWSAGIAAAVDSNRPLETPQLFIAPKPHPLTRYVTLHGARLAKAKRVTLNEPAEVLAQTDDGHPLMFHIEQLDRQAICLAFDVFESDLPFRNAFPLLLRNAVSFLHDEAPRRVLPEYEIGKPIQPLRALPTNIQSVEVTTQQGTEFATTQIPVQNGQFTIHDTASSRAMRITIGDEALFTAVNLTDARESAIAPPPVEKDQREQLALSGRLFGTMPWIGFAFAAAALVALEWLTYNFRWTE